MEMQTAASTAVAGGTAHRPGSGRRRMRGNPALTLLAVAVGVISCHKGTSVIH